MQQLYQESQKLSDASIDSIKTFTTKFSGYISAKPASQEDELYQPTIDNISNAAAQYGYKLTVANVGVMVETAWDGEKRLTF